ncbi:hypothetical protein QOT17_011725 [Balamuthia mandrillaris]
MKKKEGRGGTRVSHNGSVAHRKSDRGEDEEAEEEQEEEGEEQEEAEKVDEEEEEMNNQKGKLHKRNSSSSSSSSKEEEEEGGGKGEEETQAQNNKRKRSSRRKSSKPLKVDITKQLNHFLAERLGGRRSKRKRRRTESYQPAAPAGVSLNELEFGDRYAVECSYWLRPKHLKRSGGLSSAVVRRLAKRGGMMAMDHWTQHLDPQELRKCMPSYAATTGAWNWNFDEDLHMYKNGCSSSTVSYAGNGANGNHSTLNGKAVNAGKAGPSTAKGKKKTFGNSSWNARHRHLLSSSLAEDDDEEEELDELAEEDDDDFERDPLLFDPSSRSRASLSSQQKQKQKRQKQKQTSQQQRIGANGSSCHYCKNKKLKWVNCPIVERHRYCGACLSRHFGYDFEEVWKKSRNGNGMSSLWPNGCPLCTGHCTCAKCRRDSLKGSSSSSTSSLLQHKKEITNGKQQQQNGKLMVIEANGNGNAKGSGKGIKVEATPKRKVGRPPKYRNNNGKNNKEEDEGGASKSEEEEDNEERTRNEREREANGHNGYSNGNNRSPSSSSPSLSSTLSSSTSKRRAKT